VLAYKHNGGSSFWIMGKVPRNSKMNSRPVREEAPDTKKQRSLYLSPAVDPVLVQFDELRR